MAQRRLGVAVDDGTAGRHGRWPRPWLGSLGRWQPWTADGLAYGSEGGEEDRGPDGGDRGRIGQRRSGQTRALGSMVAWTDGNLPASRTAGVVGGEGGAAGGGAVLSSGLSGVPAATALHPPPNWYTGTAPRQTILLLFSVSDRSFIFPRFPIRSVVDDFPWLRS